MTRFIKVLAVTAAALAVLTQSQNALAQGIGASGGGGPSVVTPIPFGATIPGAWAVGTEDNPIPVSYDPAAGPWIKQLQLPVGVTFQPGQIIDVFEFITNGGPVTWTDWHEEIITPGWDWTNTANNHPSSPTDPNATFSVSDDVINMLFATPVATGGDLEINKFLTFTGAQPSTAPFIEIRQWPTVGKIPEPASLGLGLMGLVGLGMVTLRRKTFGK